ncbi:hypothetical protein [Arthrobacter sp. HMWF013]|uniref:hypothetical protein n=1 Tax=Arthrobacter sp. HMWF013 TaxID=2056849 RepID=UPI000D3A5536|nr:hypothetical protein [Arthrobacter sp. HMWF013]PTT69781.1 hypothetical protein DBR22_02905 [Arthrobacter sp. HMWF013]
MVPLSRGRPLAGDYEITAAEPGRRLAFQVVEGPARPAGEYLLNEVADGTRVRFTLTCSPKA